jgi:uncharacterized protein (DUF488 family)
MSNIYTTGYQGENINQFISKLQADQINLVIDIRENPFSRKPGFSGEKLSNNLNDNGINYLHFKELGTPKPLRDYLAHSKNYDVFFNEYKNFIIEFRDSLEDLFILGKKKNVCLLCFEKDPHFCHRKVISELLQEFFPDLIEIKHI